MAKVSGPLLSINAHGTLWDMLTFSKRNRHNVVRRQKKQTDIVTTGRTTQRDYFIEGVEKWHTLTDEEKQQWTNFIY